MRHLPLRLRMCWYSSRLTNKLLCQPSSAGRSRGSSSPDNGAPLLRHSRQGNQTFPPSRVSSSGTAQHYCILKSTKVPCPDNLPNSGKMNQESVWTDTHGPDTLRIYLKLNPSQNPKASQAERFNKTHRNITTILFPTRFYWGNATEPKS